MAPRASSSKNTKPLVSKASRSATAPSEASPATESAARGSAPAVAPKPAPAAKKAVVAVEPDAPPTKKPPVVQPTTRNGNAPTGHPTPAAVKGEKDGVSWTKEFDFKFLFGQRQILLEERVQLVGQASRLEDEANSLIEEHEMGDVQFDEESGEGDTMAVERERDLALSSQARQTVAEIDAALERITIGTYGYSVVSGSPIPRDRLEAIPWATELVEEKVGGLGRR